MSSRDRVLDLLVARATEGLTLGETEELERALLEQGELGTDDMDIAAAAVYRAYDSAGARIETMPETLKQRILRSANPGQ